MDTLKNVIIYRAGQSWIADHRLDPSGPTVRELFGTFAVPMPFTREADEATVRAELARENPGVVITRGQDVR